MNEELTLSEQELDEDATEYLAAIAGDPDRAASVEEIEHYRNAIFDPSNEYPQTEFDPWELGWLEGRYEPQIPDRAEDDPETAAWIAGEADDPPDWMCKVAPETAWRMWLAFDRPKMKVTIREAVGAAVSKLFVTASKLIPRRQQWLWEHRIPLNEVTLFAGLQGRGKSMLTMYWIAGVTRGSFGRTPSDVVLLSAEEDPRVTIVPRLMAAGADLERVHIFRIERQFALPQDIAVIEEAVRGWEVGLVVIDPLLSFLDDETDANSTKEVRRALHSLNVVKQTTTVIAVIHFRKESAGEVLHMITSSSAFSEVPRSVLGLGQEPDTKDTDGRLVLAHLKCNVGARQESRLVRVERDWVDDPEGGDPIETARVIIGEETDLSAEQVFRPNPGGRKPEKRQEAEAFLAAEMVRHGGRIPVRETKKQWAESGLGSVDTLERARGARGLRTIHDDKDGLYYWVEPDSWAV